MNLTLEHAATILEVFTTLKLDTPQGLQNYMTAYLQTSMAETNTNPIKEAARHHHRLVELFGDIQTRVHASLPDIVLTPMMGKDCTQQLVRDAVDELAIQEHQVAASIQEANILLDLVEDAELHHTGALFRAMMSRLSTGKESVGSLVVWYHQLVSMVISATTLTGRNCRMMTSTTELTDFLTDMESRITTK